MLTTSDKQAVYIYAAGGVNELMFESYDAYILDVNSIKTDW